MTAAEKINIDFADIPGNGSTVKPFKMSKTEVTMLQYVTFLNAALRAKQITVGKVESVDEEQARLSPRKKLGPRFLAFKASKQQFVLDKAGNRLIDLYGMRVTGDHNRDGKYELWEMENPLNRAMIEFNSGTGTFNVVDPKKVDWNIYFDEANLPKGVQAVDTLTNWGELQEFWPAGTKLKGRKIVTWIKGDYDKDVLFTGHLDMDMKLPTLAEIKRWPANHISYYGAMAFAKFYGLDLPNLREFTWASEGGKGYKYGSNDGTVNVNNIVYNGRQLKELPRKGRRFDFSKWPGKGKGHAQPVASMPPNPYGVYDLSGNVLEWIKTTHKKAKCINRQFKGYESFIRTGGAWNYFDQAQSTAASKCFYTSGIVALDHFGFRVVSH
ncbi:MAG: SUMF1/EgtB/PvdO family nonheme iron enzyme [Rhodospirillaceae bacterium]|nr:SUMF1/EgtB/PvdO family nonheme iron enzyme [Rhodospirillaceae bacterium]